MSTGIFRFLSLVIFYSFFCAPLFPIPLAHADRSSKPNIIFIIVDDMGYADLGCYGSKVIETPHIDRMATEGILFTNAYSGSTVCAPARSTLLTGFHMGHTSVRGNTGGISLAPTDITLGHVMKNAGYATGGFGKWGVGDIDTEGVPEKMGFDTFYGYYHQIHAHYYYPDYLIRNGKKEMLENNYGKKGDHYTHYLVMDEMKRFIRENAEKDKPFFAYAPWTPPHGDYVIPESDPGWQKYKGKKWPAKAKVVAAMTDMIDRNVGEIIDLLKELDIDDNTIIFFCSDNGASYRFEGSLDSSGPLKGAKRSMYEGGIRVPMIVRWPGTVEPDTVSDLQWYFPDVMPTLAELGDAQREVPFNIDGISVVPTLLGKGEQKKHYGLYWEWPQYDWDNKTYLANGLMQAVRVGNWKMLRHFEDKPWELYDLNTDLGEKNDLAKKRPDIVAQLAQWVVDNRTEPRDQFEPQMPEGKEYR